MEKTETNTVRLLRAMDEIAGKIATDMQLMAKGEEDGEGNTFEVSHKLVDTLVKLYDKADKIKGFNDLLLSLDEDKTEKVAPAVKKKNIQDFVLSPNGTKP